MHGSEEEDCDGMAAEEGLFEVVRGTTELRIRLEKGECGQDDD